MRIGIDITPLTRARTGVGTYTHALLKHLMDAAPDLEYRVFSSGRAEIVLGDVPAQSIALHRHIPLPTRALYQFWSVVKRPRVDRLLGGVDIFHATNYFLPPAASAKRVVTFYDLAFLRAPQWCSPKIVGPFARYVRRFAHEADAILTCSEASRQDIVELLHVPEDKVTVAYGAVEEGFAPMERAEAAALLRREYNIEGPFLLFVSTLEPRKNVAGLVRAFARVASQVPHRLVLAGGVGWNSAEIENAIQEANLGERLIRTGYIRNRRHLPAFYSAADAFVFPSFYEGFGLPVLEAMVCGCPVITSRNSSLPEVAGDAAAYVEPQDLESIAAGMDRVLNDAALAAEMRAKGYSQASKFSWPACAQATLGVYRRLAACMS